MKKELGYTFVELLTAFIVLGIVVHAAVPVLKEAYVQGTKREIQLEAANLLQRTLEEQIAGLLPCQGTNEEQSQAVPRIRYTVSWHCATIRPSLVQWNVEVQWNAGSEKTEKLQLGTQRFVPLPQR